MSINTPLVGFLFPITPQRIILHICM